MSLKDRMAKMKGILGSEAAAPLAQIDEVGEDAKLRNQKTGPRTAPGGMLVFRAHMKEHEVTVKALEEKLAQFSNGVRTLKLDPALIDESKWANRHQSNFDSPAFDKFKDEIAHAGGNIQPILVRPAKDRYEVVFGHRRFAACKQLGMPVLAMIMEMTDGELFTLMDRENRLRVDLTPYEQGVMWSKAIEGGLFASGRHLASHLGVSHVHVNQCVSIARLPVFVVELFPNPTEIQVRWANALNDCLQADPEALADRAKKIKALGKSFGSAKLLEMLIGGESAAVKNETKPIKHEGKVVGKIQRGVEGDVSFTIKPGFLSDAAFAQLQKKLGELIGK